MREVAVGLTLLCGCGRIGFDATSGDAITDGITLAIDHTRVAGDLVDFPVLIALSEPALGSDPSMLRFFDDGGSLLAHELERFTATGELLAWVKVPALSSVVDTVLVLRASEPRSAPRAAAEVWSNKFTNVHHWGDGVTVDVRDSTGVNDGQSMGGAAATRAGRIGGALDLSGGAPIRADAAGMDVSPGGLNTLSYWVDMRGPAQKSPATFAFGDCGGGCDYDVWFFAEGCVGFNTAQGEVLGTTRTGVTGRWLHVAAVFFNGTPSAANSALYFDGEPQTLTPCQPGGPAARTAGGPIYWGSYRGYEMTGVLDEGRISRGARSAAWIKTEYENQRAPATFVRVR